MQPRAQPEPLGGLPWPQEPGSGRPKVEDFSLSTTRLDLVAARAAGAYVACPAPTHTAPPCHRTRPLPPPSAPPRQLRRATTLPRAPQTSTWALSNFFRFGDAPEPELLVPLLGGAISTRSRRDLALFTPHPCEHSRGPPSRRSALPARPQPGDGRVLGPLVHLEARGARAAPAARAAGPRHRAARRGARERRARRDQPRGGAPPAQVTVVRTAAYLPRRLGDSQDEWTLPLGSLPRRLALPHPSVVARPEAEAVQAALGATIRAVATELLHESGAAADDDDAGLSKAQGWRRSSSTPRDDDA